ncbi:MAG: adenylyl-sulfate kinase [Emticicia sp.]|uniref:adenylyl-sulfate kinase n=1 Tax=Emticicia sp. TaxID=1930953 RepID=UPI003BA80151
MRIFQMTGLSGAGKTTIASNVKSILIEKGYAVEVLDGDVFRRNLCPDLGFSKQDRNENIRRMGFVANLLAQNNIIVLISAINPYESVRQELVERYQAKTVFVNCEIQTLLKRDTKGLYARAFLPKNHIDKINNLTGVNDTYEVPIHPDLTIHTHQESIEASVQRILKFIIDSVEK